MRFLSPQIRSLVFVRIILLFHNFFLAVAFIGNRYDERLHSMHMYIPFSGMRESGKNKKLNMCADNRRKEQNITRHPLTPSQEARIARIKRGADAYNYKASWTRESLDVDTNQNYDMEEGGVACTGEPSIDPSRTLQNMAGVDSEWMEDFRFEENEGK